MRLLFRAVLQTKAQIKKLPMQRLLIDIFTGLYSALVMFIANKLVGKIIFGIGAAAFGIGVAFGVGVAFYEEILGFMAEHWGILLINVICMILSGFYFYTRYHTEKKGLGKKLSAKKLPRTLILTTQDTGVPISQKIEKIKKSVFTIKTYAGHGSGFFISNKLGNWGITSRHVVENDEYFDVLLTDEKDTEISKIGRCVKILDDLDIAIVLIDVKKITPLIINPKEVNIGDEVYAIGTPLLTELHGTLTKGIVSSIRSDKEEGRLIQSDVATTHGNSGGPLLDKYGGVVGVALKGYVLGGASTSLNLFIPITEVLNKIKHSFIRTRKFSRFFRKA